MKPIVVVGTEKPADIMEVYDERGKLVGKYDPNQKEKKMGSKLKIMARMDPAGFLNEAQIK